VPEDAVVVHHQMNVQFHGHRLPELAQEPQKLLVAVPWLALGDHLSGGHVKGGEQGGSSVADVVMGNTLHEPQPNLQQRLGAIESLDLGLLVDAEHIALSVGFR